MTSAEKENIIALLEKAVHLNSEAQNAYDFQSYGNATAMRNESSAILLPLFREHRVLCETFAHQWVFLSRGDEDNGFFDADLERAKSLF